MQELQNVVATSMAKIIESGVIEQTIEKKLVETVSSIITSELRDYSEFGKGLQQHVKAALQVDFSSLGIPGYNDFILKIIRQQVTAHADLAIASQISGQLEQLLKPAPATINISEIVANFIKYNTPDGCECDGPDEITLIIDEESYGSRWVSLDKEPGKTLYRCDYRFGVSLSDGHVFGMNLDGKDIEKRLFVGNFYSFERDLFQMHASGTKVIIDKEAVDIDTYYPGRGD